MKTNLEALCAAKRIQRICRNDGKMTEDDDMYIEEVASDTRPYNECEVLDCAFKFLISRREVGDKVSKSLLPTFIGGQEDLVCSWGIDYKAKEC